MMLLSNAVLLAGGYDWQKPPPATPTYGLSQSDAEGLYGTALGTYDVILGFDCDSNDAMCQQACQQFCIDPIENLTTYSDCFNQVPRDCQIFGTGLTAFDVVGRIVNDVGTSGIVGSSGESWALEVQVTDLPSKIQDIMTLKLLQDMDVVQKPRIVYDHVHLAAIAEEPIQDASSCQASPSSIYATDSKKSIFNPTILRDVVNSELGKRFELSTSIRETWKTWLSSASIINLKEFYHTAPAPAIFGNLSHLYFGVDQGCAESWQGPMYATHRLILQWHIHGFGWGNSSIADFGAPIPRPDTVCTPLTNCTSCANTQSCTWCLTPDGPMCAAECQGEIFAPAPCRAVSFFALPFIAMFVDFVVAY